MLQFMSSLGLAPFLNSSWDERNFDVMELFKKQPIAAIDSFLNLNIEKCSHPQNKTQTVFCLKALDKPEYNKLLINEMIKEYKLNKTIIEPTVQKIGDYYLKMVWNNFHLSQRLIYIIIVIKFSHMFHNQKKQIGSSQYQHLMNTQMAD